MKNKKRIVISGGGTLGHILPILPIIKEISHRDIMNNMVT